MEKKFSTALSQEAEVGVKWNVQRRWRDSQGMLVSGIIVEHDMDRLASRDLALDGIEEADEFRVTVTLHAAGGAVPLVIVRYGLAAPRLDR